MPKIIYLDQNKWIQLARYYTKRDTVDDEIGKILELVLKKSLDGEWIFPLSFIHYNETRTRKQKEQRLELAKFMGIISRNWGIFPYGTYKKEELESNLKADNKYSPIKHNPGCLFGKLYDYETILKKCGINLSEFQAEKINEVIAGLNCFLYSMECRDNDEIINELVDDNNFYAECYKELREEDNRHTISEQAKLPVMFMQCFSADYKEILDKLAVTKEQKDNLAYQMYQKQIPKSFYVNMNLTYYSKLKNKERKNHINDYKDIVSISQALPYCDVLITERYWSALIKEHGLDKKYNTIVSDNVKILDELVL